MSHETSVRVEEWKMFCEKVMRGEMLVAEAIKASYAAGMARMREDIARIIEGHNTLHSPAQVAASIRALRAAPGAEGCCGKELGK
jgi:hypothetical protein